VSQNLQRLYNPINYNIARQENEQVIRLDSGQEKIVEYMPNMKR